MNLKEYVVRLKNTVDLNDFYHDMENEGGNLTIPDRQVDVNNRRPNSKATNYMLTEEEAEIVKQDPRVRFVAEAEYDRIDNLDWVHEGRFLRRSSVSMDYTDFQWGMYRHMDDELEPGEYDYMSNTVGKINIPYTGKNVDVIIADDVAHDPDHYEFLDDDGNSRVKYYNWFQHSQDVEGIYRPPFRHTGQDLSRHHNIHVASTAVGRSQGWAKDANIYFISVNFGQGGNSDRISGDYVFDYIREFHENKPINPETGRKNPTIVNNSWGASYGYYPELAYIKEVYADGQHYSKPSGEYSKAGLFGVVTDERPILDIVEGPTDRQKYDFIRQTYTNGYFSGQWAPEEQAYSDIPDYSNLTKLDQTSLKLSTVSILINDSYPDTLKMYGIWDDIPTPWNIDLWYVDSYEKKCLVDTVGRLSFHTIRDAGWSMSLTDPGMTGVLTGAVSLEKHDEESQFVYAYETWYGTDGVAPNREFRLVIKSTHDPLAVDINNPPEPDSLVEVRFYENDDTKITMTIEKNSYTCFTGNEFTVTQLKEWGYKPRHNHSPKRNSVESQATVEDCIDAGIIVVASAGNAYGPTHHALDPRSNNWAYIEDPVEDFVHTFYYNQTGHPASAYGGTDKQAIVVGALDITTTTNRHPEYAIEQRTNFSDHGTSVDLFAAGKDVMGAMPRNHYSSQYFYNKNGNTYYGMSGTSMATPQVTGILSCLLQKYPDMDQRQARVLLSKITGEQNAVRDSTAEIDTYIDPYTELVGATADVLYYPDMRKVDTSIYPEVNNKGRPSDGAVYPRSQIKRRKII